jgi:uncharacterized protein (UPF0276 family)
MQSSTQLNGIGLRQPHYREFRSAHPPLGFIEVHSENFFNPYDAAAQVLAAVREDYAVSLHGVGLALGSACGVDDAHIEQLAALVERTEPVRVSDHACFARAPWSQRGIVHANDLLPISFTRSSLDILCSNVEHVQERIRRPLLIENLSTYLDFAERDFSESQFFVELGRRTGCGLLLDINNLMVNALNAHESDPLQSVCNWIDELADVAAPGFVGEIHLAGFSAQDGLIIDDHSSLVSDPVWLAYQHALERLGPVPTLVEWDEHLPALPILLGEAAKADALCAARRDASVAIAGFAS